MLLVRNMHVIFDINSKYLRFNRNLILFILLFCLSVFTSFGQSMSIASFKMDETDQTANVEPTMKRDLNGDKCALIKIATTQRNFVFDVGTLGITETEWQNSNHPGEIWLYVPNGVMKISIQHPQFGTIKDYDLGSRLKKGRTYVMVLTSDQVNTLVVDYANSQILDINIFPSDAELFINGLKQNLDYNGHVSLQLPFGTHNYRVTANNYHTEESQVVINDKENKHTLSVKLKQAFGYLNVNSTAESKGGELFVDDIRVGTLPISQFPLKSGLHKISVNQKLYFPYTETIAMTDSATITITPILKPNYAECEIVVDGDKDAMIYDNGELLGTGRWKGLLEAGEHIIEARKDNHKTVTNVLFVKKESGLNLLLDSPEPIYGFMEIISNPIDSDILIDGVKYGKTPIKMIIPIGEHNVVVTKDGYNSVENKILVQESDTSRVDVVLNNYLKLTIESEPSGASVFIDDECMGFTPYTYMGPRSKLNIELYLSNEYYSAEKRIYLTKSTTKKFILSKKYYCWILGDNGGQVYIDEKYVGDLPYRIEGKKGDVFYVEIKYKESRTKIKRKIIKLGKDESFYGRKEYKKYVNAGRLTANIILTLICPTLGWISWLANPINE